MIIQRIIALTIFQNLAVYGYKYTSYNRKIECISQTEIKYPTDLVQLQKLVKDAITNNTNLKVVGNHHSITDTICTKGIPISLKNFNSVSVNEKESTATIGTGMEMMDALDQLHNLGYTINHIPAFGGITIGGAIALGAHGSSLKNANTLSEYLVGLTVIDGRGELKKLKSDDEHFDAFRVNFGLLGVLVDVTLKIEKSFKMQMHNYRVDEDQLFSNPNKLLETVKSKDWFHFRWWPNTKSLVISEGNYYDFKSKVKGECQTNLISDVNPVSISGLKLACEFVQATNNTFTMKELTKINQESFYTSNIILSLFRKPIFTKDNRSNRLANPAIGYNYKLMASNCKQCPWQTPEANGDTNNLPMQILLKTLGLNNFQGFKLPKLAIGVNSDYEEFAVALDLANFSDVVADLKKLFKQYPTAFPFLGLFFRFSPSAKGYLANSSGRDTFTIDWVYPMRLDPFNNPIYTLNVMQALMQLLVFKHNGRPHWGKNGLAFFSSEILHKAYPQQNFEKFKLAVQQYDPNRIFSNKFGDRILGIGKDEFDISDKAKHCALQDYCICSKDDDCAAKQKCGTLWGYSVCTQ